MSSLLLRTMHSLVHVLAFHVSLLCLYVTASSPQDDLPSNAVKIADGISATILEDKHGDVPVPVPAPAPFLTRAVIDHAPSRIARNLHGCGAYTCCHGGVCMGASEPPSYPTTPSSGGESGGETEDEYDYDEHWYDGNAGYTEYCESERSAWLECVDDPGCSESCQKALTWKRLRSRCFDYEADICEFAFCCEPRCTSQGQALVDCTTEMQNLAFRNSHGAPLDSSLLCKMDPNLCIHDSDPCWDCSQYSHFNSESQLTEGDDGGLTTEAIIGIVLVALFIFCSGLVIAIYCRVSSRSKPKPKQAEEPKHTTKDISEQAKSVEGGEGHGVVPEGFETENDTSMDFSAVTGHETSTPVKVVKTVITKEADDTVYETTTTTYVNES